jgi:hypothetical protein
MYFDYFGDCCGFVLSFYKPLVVNSSKNFGATLALPDDYRYNHP